MTLVQRGHSPLSFCLMLFVHAKLYHDTLQGAFLFCFCEMLDTPLMLRPLRTTCLNEAILFFVLVHGNVMDSEKQMELFPFGG